MAMATSVVRISLEAKQRLRLIAKQMGESMPSVLDRAIEIYRRKCFLKSVNEAYATLTSDKKAWASLQDERTRWDPTLMDGLDSDENRTEKE